MIVVVNSTAFIGLARIKELEILRQLYEQVYICASVYDEIVIKGADMPGADMVKNAKWIKKKEVKNMTSYRLLQSNLDPGEAGTIAIAIELNADLIVLDEIVGRRMANYMGINVIGTIGVLIDAKRCGIIHNVKSYMDKLREAEFWIDDNLIVQEFPLFVIISFVVDDYYNL